MHVIQKLKIVVDNELVVVVRKPCLCKYFDFDYYLQITK